MKGIVLAGGMGTRLYPITYSVSKQLLPLYNKPMIFYPLSLLLLSGIREILIITTPRDQNNFMHLLGDGSAYGVNFKYEVQKTAAGLPDAFIVGEKFINREPVALVLGDNFIYGGALPKFLDEAVNKTNGATIFAYKVDNPSEYGVVSFENNKAISIEEKPIYPKSNYAVTGLYFYDENVSEFSRSLTPSSRNEIEISDLNNLYLSKGMLDVKVFGRGTTWLDCGSNHSLLQASNFVEIIEERQGLKIACLEEIAFRKGFISKGELFSQANKYKNSSYGQYLTSLLDDD